ncbi:hypothetical protein FRC07_013337, partial [Ceratobasidium sp. 392]
EEVIMVNRVLRDDPSKSDMYNRQGLTPKMIWRSLCDWHMWPLYAHPGAGSYDTGRPSTDLPYIIIAQPRVQHYRSELIINTFRCDWNNHPTPNELLERGYQLESPRYCSATAMGSTIV